MIKKIKFWVILDILLIAILGYTSMIIAEHVIPVSRPTNFVLWSN